MASIKTPESPKELPLAVIKNIISLATSGFGLVVALAWNEVVKQSVETYIDPYLGRGSGLVSLLIYALVITILAVIVTMQLSGVEKRLEEFHYQAAKESASQKKSDKKKSSTK